MTNSNSPYQQLLQGILKRLDPQKMQLEIERPAIQAMETYHPSEMEKRMYENFQKMIVEMVLCLHSGCSNTRLELSQEDAFCKAIEWLDRFYPHHGAIGSEMALSEFLSGKTVAIDQIKASIQTGFISDARQRCIQAIFTEELGRDWNYRYHLTDAFFKMFSPELPPELKKANPEDFADCLEKLLLAYVQTRHSVRQLISST